MTLQDTMRTLESLGTAQNRKVYARHGAGENTFGVSFANLDKLKKRIKTDHQLAQQLWGTGNSDARSLATLIADPGKMSSSELDAWVKDIGYYVHADLFAGHVAAGSTLARKKMDAWMKSAHDFVAQVGWDLLGILAMREGDLADTYFEKHLETIEAKIHQTGNRTRHAMNNALIAIGMRNARLQKLALAAAARIGKVVVDHGQTGCQTPDAAAYILKAAARRRK
ncbi:MAG: DNA alkylation repair protein [Acidobacteriota bacterium]